MNYGEYVWQSPHWPRWQYDLAALATPMAETTRAQGRLLGRLADLGMGFRNEACLAVLTEDVVKTSRARLATCCLRAPTARRSALL